MDRNLTKWRLKFDSLIRTRVSCKTQASSTWAKMALLWSETSSIKVRTKLRGQTTTQTRPISLEVLWAPVRLLRLQEEIQCASHQHPLLVAVKCRVKTSSATWVAVNPSSTKISQWLNVTLAWLILVATWFSHTVIKTQIPAKLDLKLVPSKAWLWIIVWLI